MPNAHYTYTQASGNRMIAGSGTFPNTQLTEFQLNTAPIWIITTPNGAVIITDDGKTHQLIHQDATWQMCSSDVPYLSQMPLAVLSDMTIPPIPADISPYTTHPIYTDARIIYISSAGDVILTDLAGVQIAKHAVNALPDARPVVSDDGRLVAVYTHATDQRYVHAIMGDALEAAELLVMDSETGEIITNIALTGESVFEGMSPMWADVNLDGTQDLITTVSDSIGGAQLRVYQSNGAFLANSPSIGRGGRWRHQLAFGIFSADGQPLLAEIRTPHIGGILTFWRYNGSEALVKVTEMSGYTSHVIYSRNLDMAIGGDFDGDGIAEMVLPTQDLTALGGINLNTENEMTIRWSLGLDGELISNLSVMNSPNGLILMAGIQKSDGTYRVRVWSSIQ